MKLQITITYIVAVFMMTLVTPQQAAFAGQKENAACYKKATPCLKRAFSKIKKGASMNEVMRPQLACFKKHPGVCKYYISKYSKLIGDIN